MKKVLVILFLSMLGAVLLGGCQREPAVYQYVASAPSLVPVSLSLSVPQPWGGDIETRSIDMEEVGSTQIHSLCILQYNGTGEDAPLVGSPIYWEADDATEPVSIRLHDSHSQIHTVVFLANTFARIQPYATLGQLKKAYHTLDGPDDIWGRKENGGGYAGDPAHYYHRLHGIAVTEVSEQSNITAILHRSMARLRVSIVNDGTDGLAIRKLQLCGVPQKDYYLTDYSYIDPADNTVRSLFPEPFQDEYSEFYPMRSDYPECDWDGEADGTGEALYQWYVPANMRGSDNDGWTPDGKNHARLAEGATSLLVYASDPEGHSYRYRFYFGSNLSNDFTLSPNTSYPFRFHFSGHGNISSDARIEDLSDIDFDTDANCYILNPLPDRDRSYTFNAIHRPNIFWGERYGLNVDYPNYTIDLTKNWKARVIWADFQMTPEQVQDFLSKCEGDGSGDYMSASQRIRVTLPAGMTSGNVIVGMYIDDPSNMLWSWHLWITDYTPDAIQGQSPVQGEYIYLVPGGEVHRYAGVSWQEGGRYEKGYAMDRMIGALDIIGHPYGERGCGMGYQFGRKDPFPAISTIYLYAEDGTSSAHTGARGSNTNNNMPNVSYSALLGMTGGHNVPYSVNHPSTIIRGSSWTSGDCFNPLSPGREIIWNDPKNTEKTLHEETGDNADKSLFDPCPAGWRIPTAGNVMKDNWFSGFTGDYSSYETTSPLVNFQHNVETYNGHLRGSGKTYYPNGFLSDKDNKDAPTIFFPFYDYRNDGGYFSHTFGTTCNFWSDRSRDEYNADCIYFSNWNSGTDPFDYSKPRQEYRRNTYSIRCVKL